MRRRPIHWFDLSARRFPNLMRLLNSPKSLRLYDGIYASHMRHEDAKIYEALDEVFCVARGEKSAPKFPIKLSGEKSRDRPTKSLPISIRFRAEGLDITEDQYAYTASSTTMRQLIPDDAFDGGKKFSSNSSTIPKKGRPHHAHETEARRAWTQRLRLRRHRFLPARQILNGLKYRRSHPEGARQ